MKIKIYRNTEINITKWQEKLKLIKNNKDTVPEDYERKINWPDRLPVKNEWKLTTLFSPLKILTMSGDDLPEALFAKRILLSHHKPLTWLAVLLFLKRLFEGGWFSFWLTFCGVGFINRFFWDSLWAKANGFITSCRRAEMTTVFGFVKKYSPSLHWRAKRRLH